MRRRALGVVLVVLVVAPAAQAQDRTTTCVFGGPTPGFRAMRIDLPAGSAGIDVRLTTPAPTPPQHAGDRASWHLASGIAVVDAVTLQLVTTRVAVVGSSPRRVVVERDGADVVRQEVVAPGAPFEHRAGTPVPHLRPGAYYLIGFGSDGDRRVPNPWWSAEVTVQADVACTPLGHGEVFDHDHTSFRGGTQVSAFGAGVADDVTLGFSTTRRLVFGMMDSATQVAGEDELSYALPDGRSGTVRGALVPFVAGAGDYAFRATFSGAFPVALVTGVAVDVE